MSAIGGENVTTTIEGRARYPVNVRYPRELRDNIERLSQVLVSTPGGSQIPIAQIADIKRVSGPSMIRDENGMLAGYVFVDLSSNDIGGYVEHAKQIVREKLSLPTGYSLVWSGQYENMLRVRERLKIVVPITLFLIFALLYMNTKSAMKASIVMLAVPFSLIGAVWLMWILGYNISIAAWVGMIALMGLDAETGVFMLLFLDLSYDDAKRKGQLRNKADLIEAIIHGAVKRVRPKMMTVSAAFMGLMPIMWSIGAGSDMMKRVVAPMVGGPGHILCHGTAGLSGHLLPLEMANRSQTSGRSPLRKEHRYETTERRFFLLLSSWLQEMPGRKPFRLNMTTSGAAARASWFLATRRSSTSRRKKEHARSWKYEDIQQLAIASGRISILTYDSQENRAWRRSGFQLQAAVRKVERPVPEGDREKADASSRFQHCAGTE